MPLKANAESLRCPRNSGICRPNWSDVPALVETDTNKLPAPQYYMSPTFVPRSVVRNDRLDWQSSMYDPEQQRVYVWSQWDF